MNGTKAKGLGPARMASTLARLASLFLASLAAIPASAQAGYEPEPAEELAAQAVMTGVTAYDPAHLLIFAISHAAADGKNTSAQDVASAIEQIYREDGYSLAHVTLAYSEDGHPVFRIDEGTLNSVAITGLRPGSERKVRAYAERLISAKPVMHNRLERALALASDLSGIAIASNVVPDPSGTGSILAIGGAENRSSGAAGIEIVPLRPGSAVRAFAVQEFYGVATGGDMLRVLGQATLDRGDDWSVSGLAFYRAPVGSSGTYIEALGGNTVARRDFVNLTGDSELIGWNGAFVIGHPIERSLNSFTYVLAEYEYIDARSRFLAQRLESSTHAVRLRAIKGADHANGTMYRAAVTLSLGSRPETPVGALPDGAETFAHVRSELGMSLPLDKYHLTSLRAELRGQWASVRLPAVERIAMGHAPFLRGYAPAEVVGDRGYGATIEVMRSISTSGELVTEVAPFIFGAVGYTQVLQPRLGERDEVTVASAGVGSSFALKGGIRLSGWAAMPLRDGPQSRSGDIAFHASVTVGW